MTDRIVIPQGLPYPLGNFGHALALQACDSAGVIHHPTLHQPIERRMPACDKVAHQCVMYFPFAHDDNGKPKQRQFRVKLVVTLISPSVR